MTLKQPVSGRFSNPDLVELSELTSATRFSANCGDARQGRRLSIFVKPKVQRPGGAMRVLVVIHVFGLRKVDWSGCILAVRQEQSGERPVAFAFLHPHGQAVFERLPLGSYRLSLQPYGPDIWTDAGNLPSLEQIEDQSWLQPEKVCRALALCAAQAAHQISAGVEAVALLGALAGRSEAMAKPALGVCLEILCNPSVPSDLRCTASNFITSKNTAILSDIDLSAFFLNLSIDPLPSHLVEKPESLEKKIYDTFGTLLSYRSTIGTEEKKLLEVLVARSQISPVPPRPVAVHTRGSVRTRGAVGAPPNEKLLLALAQWRQFCLQRPRGNIENVAGQW